MPASKNSITGTIVAVAAFLAIIGGLTWYLQFMPNRGGAGQARPVPDPVPTEVLRFLRPAPQRGPLHAVWELNKDKSDAEYMLESEKGEKGEYCFLFQNVLDRTAEFEMERAACHCTRAEICVVPEYEWQQVKAALAKEPWGKPDLKHMPEWKACNKNENAGIKIPAKGCGILRIHWDGRQDPGTVLNLHMWFWCQPEGEIGNRQQIEIIVPVRIVYPLQFDTGKQAVGILGPGDQATAGFHVWSATRTADALDVSFAPQPPDPLFTVKADRLTDAECRKLEAKLTAESKELKRTHIRVGYFVQATVHEQAGGQQMDQGPFLLALPITVDQAPAPFSTPLISGHVRGPLDVGGEADRGRVQFNQFSAAATKSVSIPIYGNPQFSLAVDQQYPPFLQVDLKRNKKESTPQRGRWDLKVTIPAGSWSGVLPEQTRVLVRIAARGNEKARLVRIPVIGTATQ